MKIVLIGGVAAGAKAAAKSRRLLPDAEIDIYTQDTHVSYSACGLPYYIEGNFEDWHKLIIRSVEEFEKNNIHIHFAI
jgi:NADPH-dependent 2,4-dienoyl-CoA reductase/sulfur reductase-like enzyme